MALASGLEEGGIKLWVGMEFFLAGVTGKQQWEGVLLDVGGQLIENPLEMFFWAGVPFFEGMEHGHLDLAGFSSFLRLRSETHLAGNDGGGQFSFTAIVVGRD